MKKFTSLLGVAFMVFAILNISAIARDRLIIQAGPQMDSGVVYPGELSELFRIPFKDGSHGAVNQIHVGVYGPASAIDFYEVFAESDAQSVVKDKNGVLQTVHSVKQRIVGRYDVPTPTIGVGITTSPTTSARYISVVIPVRNDLIQSGQEFQTYVVYGHFGWDSYNHNDEYIQSWLQYVETDGNTDVTSGVSEYPMGAYNKLSTDIYHATVYVTPEQPLHRVFARPGQQVVIATVSVDVYNQQVRISDPDFEIWASDMDPKVLAHMGDLRIYDIDDNLIAGPLKAQFKLENGRVKVVFEGLTLVLNQGRTSLKIVGRFGFTKSGNSPEVTLTARPATWKCVDSTNRMIVINQYGTDTSSVVFPAINLAPIPHKGG